MTPPRTPPAPDIRAELIEAAQEGDRARDSAGRSLSQRVAAFEAAKGRGAGNRAARRAYVRNLGK